jgi:trehalose 6-phosphate synthase/phosphatase
VIRVPGAFIEEKSTSLAWHYRMADGEFGANQAKELHLHLSQTFSNAPVEVLAGEKVVEVRPHGVHKGVIIERLKPAAEGARMMAIGDDQTDEDLFAALPGDAVAIHVGPRPSRAQYRIPDVTAARRLLWALVKG